MKHLIVVLTLVVSTFVNAQSNEQIRPRVNETLREYEVRMEAYFAPQIAQRGLQALVEEEGSEYNEYRKFLLFWSPRLGPAGDFRPFFQQEVRQLGKGGPRRRVVRNDENALASNGAVVNDVPWQEIGPIERPSGNGSARGIGPMEFLTFYAPGPSRMLAGSTAGGLFYSRDSGTTWLRTGTDTKIGRPGVSSAVFHPSSSQTWFAASAGNSSDNDALWIGLTGGIFRTTDEGATWTQIATQGQLGGVWTKIFLLVIHPSDGNQLWAATSNGVYYSSNAMATSPTWNLVAFAGESVFDFELRPGNPQWRYATVASYGTNGLTNWRFLYTNDGGATWLPVPNQPPSTATAKGLTIEVSPAKADNLYCVTNLGPSAVLAIYDFGTGAWTTVTSNALIDMGGGKGFAVDPFNANEIFLTQRTEGRRYDASNGTFIQFNSAYYGGTYHQDIEDFVPHPVSPNEVWMCHHGGIARSVDNGATWSDRSTGLGVAEPLRFGTSPTDPRYVLMGTYHDGTVMTDSPWYELWSPPWRLLFGGDGLVPLVSPASPQFMWVTYQSGSWYRSSDYGQTFSYTGPPYSPFWVVDGAFDVPNPTTQYRLIASSVGDNVSRSFDNGTTWTTISQFQTLWPQTGGAQYILWRVYTPETTSGTVVAHLLERPTQGDWWHHHLYRTTIATDPIAANVAASWTELPLPADLWISDIEFDPTDPNILYIANASPIYMGFSTFGIKMVIRVDYTNPGAHTLHQCNALLCEDVTQNLPNASTGGDSLAIETTGGGGLYYVCDYGAYYSNAATRAAGHGWSRIGSKLPNTQYQGLELNLVNHKVRVASMGRGAWEHDMVATVAGMKFDDVNGSGQRDPGEPGLANWTIRITDSFANVTTTTTNAAGEYVFTNLPAGDYVIDEVQQSGWTQKFPASGSHTVHVDAGQRTTGLDFGNRVSADLFCVAPPLNMVAWWGLDAGGVADDFAGFNNAGSVNGGATATAGHVFNWMHFNGTTQYVEVPSHPELQMGTSDLTIDAWVRTTKTGICPIVDKRGGALFGYTLFLFNGRLGFEMADRSGSQICSNSPNAACTNFIAPVGSANVADGLVHHVAVTVDRDSATGGRLWVDGAIVFTFDPTIRNQSLDTTANLLIGKRSAVSSALYWDGELDEIEIFKRALTPAEIQSMVKAGKNGKCRCGNCQ